jgi:hypothetical protein
MRVYRTCSVLFLLAGENSMGDLAGNTTLLVSVSLRHRISTVRHAIVVTIKLRERRFRHNMRLHRYRLGARRRSCADTEISARWHLADL